MGRVRRLVTCAVRVTGGFRVDTKGASGATPKLESIPQHRVVRLYIHQIRNLGGSTVELARQKGDGFNLS